MRIAAFTIDPRPKLEMAHALDVRAKLLIEKIIKFHADYHF